MKLILALLLMVFLPYVIGSLFIYGGVRIIDEERVIEVGRAKGRFGFELPVVTKGKEAVEVGRINIAIGCSCLFVALFIFALFIIYRLPH
jgi:hypothetical protein